MNRALTLLAILMLTGVSLEALPEGKADGTQRAPAAPAADTAKATAGQADSPLVQAARRAKRLGKASSTPVITNESVKKSTGAHITTTTRKHPGKVKPISLTQTQRAEMARNENEAKAEALRLEQEAKAAEETAKASERKARAAQLAEEGYYEDLDDDPARAEQLSQEVGSEPAAQEQKPPRS
jgi:hypothetical protein